MTTPKTAGAVQQAVKLVPISSIVVPEDRKRSVKALGELSASIQALGLLNPIILGKDHKLIAGLHRLRACEALGWKEIPAVVMQFSELDAELAEIDENLCRAELTVLERAEQTLRRKVIYEQKHPEPRRGVAGVAVSNRNQGKITQPTNLSVVSFSADTAAKTGGHARGVERDVQVAQGIAPAVRETIRNTPLADHQGDLLALARIEAPAEQAAAADLVVRGAAKNVPDALKQLEGESTSDAETTEVVRDHLGQVISDPEIAEAYTTLNARIDAMVLPLRTASRAWGKHFHEELVAARKLRFVEASEYMGLRAQAEQKLKDYIGLLQLHRPYALCPYCKGEPLGKNRLKYCRGCGGGGWVARDTYESAPPELQVPGTGLKSRERQAVDAEVDHE